MSVPEDELRTSILWPYQVWTVEARRAWRMSILCILRIYPGHGGEDVSVPVWVNRVLAAVDLAMHQAGGMMVVEEAARVLRDPDLCLAVRAAWALGGVEAAAGAVKREAYPVAQGAET